jgi:putative N6-adenine-specific DNA methylase
MSVRDCQSIVKKAIVENIKQRCGGDWLAEDGPQYQVDFSILKDRVTIALDSSGAGLHKRGYRDRGGIAPLRETLAAALVLLSYWNPERPFADPFCGSGTIVIEAALIGRALAPGLGRSFAAEGWPQLGEELWRRARQEARDQARPAPAHRLAGTDIDKRALDFARHHAARAGVGDDVHFQEADVGALTSKRSYGCVLTNPPYGERLGDRRDAEELYRRLAAAVEPLDTWSVYVLTAHPGFEQIFGRRATRRRKLYNGRIECTYYQYAGPRPPRPNPKA